MILVDTSVWVGHLRAADVKLTRLLNDGLVVGHPWVTGEISLGNLANRTEIQALLGNLPQAQVATPAEVATLIETHRLHGLGIGYVDTQLVASTLLTADTLLWTADRRLSEVATRLGIQADLATG